MKKHTLLIIFAFVLLCLTGCQQNGVNTASDSMSSDPPSAASTENYAAVDLLDATPIPTPELEHHISGDYMYTVNENGSAAITNYTGTADELIIPVAMDDYKVTSIGEYAFEQCTSLISVKIPDSVTSIGRRAFFACSSLSSVTIPERLISIGDEAFSYCSSLNSITLPDSVTSIGSYAFSDCSSLSSVILPDSVTSMGSNPFMYCEQLTDIVVSNDHPYLAVNDGVLFSKPDNRLVCYPCSFDSKTYIIPNETKIIGDCAFFYCRALTFISLPNSVISIGEAAFLNCSSLTSVRIPNSVTTIGDAAFYNCSSMTSITIPNSVSGIGKAAFFNCASLTSVTLPNSVTNIGEAAFYNCSSLISIDIPDSIAIIVNRVFSDSSTLTPVIPHSSISAKVFSGYTSAESIFPNTIEVGDYVTFGKYSHNAEGTDKTPIEWLVLDIQDGKALLLSRYGLDARAYNTMFYYTTWETCSLRKWLNDVFLRRAFNAEEKAAILTTHVDNSDSQGYGNWHSSGGKDTQDKVFLLSYAEANRYFGVEYSDDRHAGNISSRVSLTEYAIRAGAFTNKNYKTTEKKEAGWWWLRSPGESQLDAARVDYNGCLGCKSVGDLYYDNGAVRPAIWVNLEYAIQPSAFSGD